MIIDDNEIGLGFGLNKRRKNNGEGSRVGKFLRKNVRVKNINVKNAIAAASIGASFIPGAGAGAAIAIKAAKIGKITKAAQLALKAKKLLSSGVGRAIMGVVKNKLATGQQINQNEEAFVNQVVVAQDTDPNTPNITTPEEFNQIAPGSVQANAPTVKVSANEVNRFVGSGNENSSGPSEEQLETISKMKGIPKENLTEEAQNQQKEADNVKGAGSNPPSKKNNTMLYVAGGIGVLAVIGIAMSKSSTSAVAATK